MSINHEYQPGSAIPKSEKIPQSFRGSEEVSEAEVAHSTQDRNLDKESAAVDSLNQASIHIVELSEGDTETVELLHLLGNELDLIAYQHTGAETDAESRISLLKRALRAAARAAHEEIGRG